MTWLLDGNVLIAELTRTHLSHDAARAWRAKTAGDTFATCSVTEGTLLRLHMMIAQDKSAKAAWNALDMFRESSNHIFWNEGFSYTEISPKHIQGHRQITDAWLAALARKKGGRVATFDQGFATAHPDVVTLIPA